MIWTGIHEAVLGLESPFVTGACTFTERRVLLFELSESGLSAFGESAPLEFFGTESYRDSREMLHKAAEVLQEMHISDKFIDKLDAILPESASTPCARFAIESAVLDLLSKRKNLPLADYLSGRRSERLIPVNAVIGAGEPHDTERRCAELVESGFSCLKIKVGVGSVSRDVRNVEAARRGAGPDVRIRLDANGAWTLPEAEAALTAFAPYDIEYVEQPVPPHDQCGLKRLARNSPIPIAADEPLQSLVTARELLQKDACDVFVLKPMAAGSLIGSRIFALDALAACKGVTFSSMIEGPVGCNAVAHLAASIPQALSTHHGLAACMLFSDTAACERVRNGVYALDEHAGIGVAIRELCAYNCDAIGKPATRRGR